MIKESDITTSNKFDVLNTIMEMEDKSSFGMDARKDAGRVKRRKAKAKHSSKGTLSYAKILPIERDDISPKPKYNAISIDDLSFSSTALPSASPPNSKKSSLVEYTEAIFGSIEAERCDFSSIPQYDVLSIHDLSSSSTPLSSASSVISEDSPLVDYTRTPCELIEPQV